MKTVRTGLWLSLALIEFFAACRHDDPTPAVPNGYIELRAGTTVPVIDGISVAADTVGVAFCPKNAYCIIADHAYAIIRLVDSQGSHRICLTSGVGLTYHAGTTYRSDSTVATLSGRVYKVILQGQYIGEKDGQPHGRAVLQVGRL